MIVLVPEDEGLLALGSISGVQPVPYELEGSLPPEAADARVLVAGSGAPDRVVALLPQLPALQLVQTLSAGVEQWTGLLPPRLRLSNARGAHGGATAEWAAAMLLAIYRELPRFEAARREHRWDQHTTDTLEGKRVLIVGAGDLASELRRRIEPFGVSVSLVGRSPRHGVHTFSELSDLLGAHDAVVIMVPLTSATRGLVGSEFLAAMPRDAVLVNAARGRVVDTDALLSELRRGRLRAALDVTDPEPLPENHPLWQAPGLLLTPHVGGATRGAAKRAWAVAARQIAMFADGQEPENLVAPDELRA